MNQNYASLSVATSDMRERGFTKSFIPSEFDVLNPAEWRIIELYRFEGMNSASDNSVVYGVKNIVSGEKGIIINAYGVYNDEEVSNFIKLLKYE